MEDLAGCVAEASDGVLVEQLSGRFMKRKVGSCRRKQRLTQGAMVCVLGER